MVWGGVQARPRALRTSRCSGVSRCSACVCGLNAKKCICVERCCVQNLSSPPPHTHTARRRQFFFAARLLREYSRSSFTPAQNRTTVPPANPERTMRFHLFVFCSEQSGGLVQTLTRVWSPAAVLCTLALSYLRGAGRSSPGLLGKRHTFRSERHRTVCPCPLCPSTDGRLVPTSRLAMLPGRSGEKRVV